MEDLISVIVPVYNIRDYLPRCVESICNQTYSHLEIILVDDGSNDGTEKLVDELAAKDTRIRVFHKENGGSSSARNLGIRQAQGCWLGFVDSDDFISPQMYERLIRAVKQEGLSMAQISRDEMDEQGKLLPNVCEPPSQQYICPSQEFLRQLLLHQGDCSYCTKLIARELFDKYTFPEGVLNEDFYLLLQMLQEIEGAVILPQQEYHVFYRIGSNTRKKSKNEFSRVFMDIVNHADFAARLVEKKYPELKQEALRFSLYQRLEYLLHIPIAMMERKNTFYQSVKGWLRKHGKDILTNPCLTRRDRSYLLLLTVAPKTVRRVHGWKMKVFS